MIGPVSLHWVTHWSRERRRFWTSIFHLVTDEGFQRGSGSIRQVFYEVEEIDGLSSEDVGGFAGEEGRMASCCLLIRN